MNSIHIQNHKPDKECPHSSKQRTCSVYINSQGTIQYACLYEYEYYSNSGFGI